MSYHYKRDLLKRLDDDSLPALSLDDRFSFACKADCMGRCCQNITILLDPWDVEIMARFLAISGRQFISQYCKLDFSHELKWPYVRLKHAEDGSCIFMLQDGRCKIYPVRSRNCRTYPIGRAVRFASDGTKQERIFMVEKMDFCLGHKSQKNWTVKEWLHDAESEKFYRLSDLYLELIHYATTHLNSQVWMNPHISQILMPLLYGPDSLRSKLEITEQAVNHEEFYCRRMKALKAVLTELAAGFGYGPLAQTFVNSDNQGSMMERVKKILLTGQD
ncbi:hypothetical protein JCM39194_04270 [Desulfotomaculum varum]